MSYQMTIDGTRWIFPDLKTLLAKASPARAGDALAGIAAQSATERVAAQMALADLPSRPSWTSIFCPMKKTRFLA
jgi:ethanolamine ammonia-lyase large subunit